MSFERDVNLGNALSLNHFVLISTLGMGLGHRNCVVAGWPNRGKRLNKWAKQTCTAHAYLNVTQPATVGHHSSFSPFPLRKRIAKE